MSNPEIKCADCGGPVGETGPPDGWQLEDGRTVCHTCCRKDFGAFARLLLKEQRTPTAEDIAFMRLGESAFEFWNNPVDSEYDKL